MDHAYRVRVILLKGRLKISQQLDKLASRGAQDRVASVNAVVGAIVLDHQRVVDDLKHLQAKLLEIFTHGINLEPRITLAMHEANTEVVYHKRLSLALHTVLLHEAVDCRSDLQHRHNLNVVVPPDPLDVVAQVLDGSELIQAETASA